jgi:hypothetical protein
MARLRSIGRRLRSFVRMDGRRRALLVEAAAWLVLARLALIVVPFPRLARGLGTFVRPADDRVLHARSLVSQGHSRLAKQIGWAVTRAARALPFCARCLPQAMAARIMLRRRGVTSVMHFGAMATELDSFDAHAWLEAAGVGVTGYPVAEEAVEIACFV